MPGSPFDKTRGLFALLLTLLATGLASTPVQAQINCSVVTCVPADQPSIGGYPMFNETNFDPVVDGFGRTRKFWLHIPVHYDTVDGVGEKIPLVFAFHGGGQTREAMVAGKWGDYFDDEVAFVIPLGEPDPCDNPFGNGKSQWLSPGPGRSTSPMNVNCDPATQVIDSLGTTKTYWNAALTGTFTDVLFVESLRAMILSRFTKLNSNKVYATGFSSGGGMTLALACYRASLFRGFSVVAKLLAGDGPRGDYDQDGVVETDPMSLVATCGKSVLDPGHATGIATPRIWGFGMVFPAIPATPFFPGQPAIFARVAKPFALIAGDQDNPLADINQTGNEIRTRNNLNGTFFLVDPFLDTAMDDATTQRRTFVTALDATQSSATFRRFLVRGIANHSATHAMPDAQECPPIKPFGDSFMTCDWDYTDQTLIFWQDHADLNLLP